MTIASGASEQNNVENTEYRGTTVLYIIPSLHFISNLLACDAMTLSKVARFSKTHCLDVIFPLVFITFQWTVLETFQRIVSVTFQWIVLVTFQWIVWVTFQWIVSVTFQWIIFVTFQWIVLVTFQWIVLVTFQWIVLVKAKFLLFQLCDPNDFLVVQHLLIFLC